MGLSCPDELPCPFCKGSGHDADGLVCLRCEGSGNRDTFRLLRAFEVGYAQGIALVYDWLGVKPPAGISTRAITPERLLREVQRLEDESLRHYD